MAAACSSALRSCSEVIGADGSAAGRARRLSSTGDLVQLLLGGLVVPRLVVPGLVVPGLIVPVTDHPGAMRARAWIEVGHPPRVHRPGADHPPACACRRSGDAAQPPAEFADVPVRLGVVAPPAGRDDVLPHVLALSLIHISEPTRLGM